MPAVILSVVHRKGGVGKTSTTLHLASALAIKKKKRVLVIDTDSQQSAFKYREFEQNNYYADKEPPYTISRVLSKYLFDEIKFNREKYDVIFIDVPRITGGEEDSLLSTVITYCDGILIPVVAGDLEGLSSLDFIKLVKGIDEYKKEKGFDFTFYGFLNKRNRRTENDEAIQFMKGQGVSMFDNSLSDVKALSKPYTFETVLDDKDGESRFDPFFKEFIKKYEI